MSDHSSDQSPVIELRNVVKEYPTAPATRVLHGVDLRIDRGALVAIVGPSGSGKSTLLNLMGTLDRPTSGEVVVDGHDVSTMSDAALSALRATTIGFVFQQFFLLPGSSAIDNVADGMLYSGRSPHQRRAMAVQALERVGLGHRLHHSPQKLSGGEQQRVAIARALVGAPAVILADEPTGNLDSRSSAAIVALLHDLHAAGGTIVVITHDHEIAAQMPRYIAVRDGRIESDSAYAEAGR
jgi:putative ABC transport system ATP-binding protein